MIKIRCINNFSTMSNCKLPITIGKMYDAYEIKTFLDDAPLKYYKIFDDRDSEHYISATYFTIARKQKLERILNERKI
jgi:hypothetical protein